jgi:predicted DNA binding protein
VFAEYDCVPEIVDVDENRLHIEACLPDRDRLTDLVEALKEVGESVRLRKLTRIDGETGGLESDTVTLDLFDVTEKQREAVTTAVAAGYYSRPRETSFDRLADELDISKSALSQRLNAVESKLATAAVAAASPAD